MNLLVLWWRSRRIKCMGPLDKLKRCLSLMVKVFWIQSQLSWQYPGDDRTGLSSRSTRGGRHTNRLPCKSCNWECSSWIYGNWCPCDFTCASWKVRRNWSHHGLWVWQHRRYIDVSHIACVLNEKQPGFTDALVGLHLCANRVWLHLMLFPSRKDEAFCFTGHLTRWMFQQLRHFYVHCTATTH